MKKVTQSTRIGRKQRSAASELADLSAGTRKPPAQACLRGTGQVWLHIISSEGFNTSAQTI